MDRHADRARTSATEEADNPKLDPAPGAIKDPADWVSGGDPMTPAQASYLKTLSEQADEADAFDPDLNKAEASEKIDDLKQALER
jgi:hypothetical protein